MLEEKYSVLRGKSVLIVEDDPEFAYFLSVNLEATGFAIVQRDNEEDTLAWLSASEALDVAIVDMYLPSRAGEGYDSVLRGESIAMKIRRAFPDCVIIGISSRIPEAPRTHLSDLFDSFLFKGDWDKYSTPVMLFEDLENHLSGGVKGPKAFIVHGHDHSLVDELKALLHDEYEFPKPIVLQEEADGGRTIIEKFEAQARLADIVFVCMTPDDLVIEPSQKTRQARPNVHFELGFFYGKFQRRRGRVLLLVNGEVGIPSDLQGIIWIDISSGLDLAKPHIERELAAMGFTVNKQ